jgi:sec-independent protein translocase protein TatC
MSELAQAQNRSNAGEMSLIEHLRELRVRLIRSVLAVVIAAIAVYLVQAQLFDFLSEPYCAIRAENDCTFLVTDPMGEFNVALTLAGYGGLILALPFVLYQLGRFVLPGLYPHERRVLLPFLGVAVVLLFTGMVAAYLFLPRALEVLSGIGSDRFEQNFTPNNYLSFFVKMVLAFGIAAEFPLVLVFLQLTGLLKTETLRKNRRVAAVAITVLAAVITPTGDPFTLAVVGVPMYLFYEISMLIGAVLGKKRSTA